MLFRKTILFLSAIAVSFLTSCTTRYQDMLRERDERIRELSGNVAQLRGENDELQARATAAPANANATASTPKSESPGEVEKLQGLVGDDASVSYIRGKLSIGVKDSVTFDSGSTALKDSAHRVLQNIASVLKGKYSGRRFYIEGHTDADPIVKTKDKFTSNRHLSVMRADSVVRYLIDQGVPESSFVVMGYGQFDPISSAKNKADNRRVQIVIGEQK